MSQANLDKENELIVRRCLQEHYGIEGSISRLSGENFNYLVCVNGGDKYIFKIVDDDMPSAVVAMENCAIEYAISHHFTVKLPKIIENKQHKIETGIRLRKYPYNRPRLLEIVEGTHLDSVSDISILLRQNVGKMLVNFNLAMEKFTRPVVHRNHRWNLANADQHQSKVVLFDDQEQRQLLTWAFDLWGLSAKSKFFVLPHQFILGQKNPLQTAANIVSGYHQNRPLSDPELTILLPLVCGRLAVSISVAEERRQIYPDHPNWFSSDS